MVRDGRLELPASSAAPPFCGARKNHRAFASPRFFRPLHQARSAASATGSAERACPKLWSQDASKLYPPPQIIKSERANALSLFMVRDGRLELPASCSQSRRATNCANPGYLVVFSGALPTHRCVSRFPLTIRDRQSGHFLETASLFPPPAALRRFPQSRRADGYRLPSLYYKGRQCFFQAFPSLRQTFKPARVIAAVNQNTHWTRG